MPILSQPTHVVVFILYCIRCTRNLTSSASIMPVLMNSFLRWRRKSRSSGWLTMALMSCMHATCRTKGELLIPVHLTVATLCATDRHPCYMLGLHLYSLQKGFSPLNVSDYKPAVLNPTDWAMKTDNKQPFYYCPIHTENLGWVYSILPATCK